MPFGLLRQREPAAEAARHLVGLDFLPWVAQAWGLRDVQAHCLQQEQEAHQKGQQCGNYGACCREDPRLNRPPPVICAEDRVPKPLRSAPRKA